MGRDGAKYWAKSVILCNRKKNAKILMLLYITSGKSHVKYSEDTNGFPLECNA